MRIQVLLTPLLFIVFNLPAQNYYVQITNDVETHVADIAHSEFFSVGNKAIVYNVKLSNGNEDFGLIVLDNTNTVLISKQFHLNSYILRAKKILPSGRINNIYVLAEKIDPNSPNYIKPVIIEFDQTTGSLVNVREMPALPATFNYVEAFDLMYESQYLAGAETLKILCEVWEEPGSATLPIAHIFELNYNIATQQSFFTKYTPFRLLTILIHYII